MKIRPSNIRLVVLGAVDTPRPTPGASEHAVPGALDRRPPSAGQGTRVRTGTLAQADTDQALPPLPASRSAWNRLAGRPSEAPAANRWNWKERQHVAEQLRDIHPAFVDLARRDIDQLADQAGLRAVETEFDFPDPLQADAEAVALKPRPQTLATRMAQWLDARRLRSPQRNALAGFQVPDLFKRPAARGG